MRLVPMARSCPRGRRNLALALLSATSLAGVGVHSAQAQTAPREGASSVQIEEVIVTANRGGAQALQNVPMAITAVSVNQLERAGQGSFGDLAKLTPSLSITEGAPGFQKFDMRGLATGGYRTSDTSDRSLVAVYLDDTPISVQGQTPDLKVYDLERVEVLRGPQGTLYGASSMAGTIRFVTAKPNLNDRFGTFEASTSTTQHGAGSYNLRGTANVPLVEGKLALRAAVYHGEDGGYIDNIGVRKKDNANLARTSQARLALRWTPTDKLTADFSATVEHSKAYGLNQAFSGLPGKTILTNSPEGTQDRMQLYSLNLDYDLGAVDLISTTSYTARRIGYNASPEPQIAYFFQDYTGLPAGPGRYPLFKQPTAYSQDIARMIPAEQYTIKNRLHDWMQELRLVSKGDGPLRWTAGVFYEHQTRHLRQDIPVPGFDTLSYENYFYGPFNTPNRLYNSKTVDAAFNENDIFSGLQDQTEHQLAAYADATWKATDKLELTAGLRYFDFSEKYYLFESGVYGVVDHKPLTLNAKLKSTGVNPRFNASYHINENLMVYAEAAKGFRYGGANQPVPLGTAGIAGQCTRDLGSYGYSAAPLTFGPDHLWNYSVGQKAKLAGGRMTLNADVYYISWKDVQTRLLLNCSYFFTDNKGEITSKGAEVESTLRVTDNLTFSGSVSYNNARASGNIPTVGAFDGDRSPYFPKWIATAALFYDRDLSLGKLHLQAMFNYRGEEQTTFNPSATTIANGQLVTTGPNPTFAIIPSSKDLSMSAALDMGRYEVGVFGTNLTNGVGVTNIGRATYYKIYQPGDRVTLARPRTVGTRLKVKF
jgi:iron complex outermembrane recepter protein